jgi:deoxyribodipyrimidine photolyase-related protein
VIQPTSRSAVGFVRTSAAEREVELLPARGYVTTREDFTTWAESRGRRRLLLEDFYRDARRRHGVLMEGDEPVGGRWNLDAENREPPPRGQETLGVAEPRWPEEDDIDGEVRDDLDRWERNGDVRFVGRDGPRLFAATRTEAVAALDHFVQHRLSAFGPQEDAVMKADAWMAHSLLSAPMNLGLLDPVEVIEAAEEAYRRGDVPLQSAEGFVRQVMGWRDYVWASVLASRRGLPACEPARRAPPSARLVAGPGRRRLHRAHSLPPARPWLDPPHSTADDPGNFAAQRGWRPDELTDWYHRSFVDGYDWVMVPTWSACRSTPISG